MSTISPVSIYSPDSQRQERREQVAVGVGGAAGVAKSATTYAGKKGLKATAIESTLSTVNTATRELSQSASKIDKMWFQLKKYNAMFTNDIRKRLTTISNSKVAKALLESPVARNVTGAIGGALAFFVVATEINKSVKTGELAVQDFKEKYMV